MHPSVQQSKLTSRRREASLGRFKGHTGSERHYGPSASAGSHHINSITCTCNGAYRHIKVSKGYRESAGMTHCNDTRKWCQSTAPLLTWPRDLLKEIRLPNKSPAWSLFPCDLVDDVVKLHQQAMKKVQTSIITPGIPP